jgi:hypothetical protein
MDETAIELLKWLILIGILTFVFFRASLSVFIGLKPYKCERPEKDANVKATATTALWAEKNDFDLLGYFTVQYSTISHFMAVWKSRENLTYLCQVIIETGRGTIVAGDFTTIFDGEIELATDGSKASHFFPKHPGSYCQTFPRSNFDERYKMHLEAEQYLIKEGWAQLKKPPLPFEEGFVSSLKKESRWRRKHWYWTFFILYFYFIRQYRWRNKTIQQQHELGMIRLPNEINPHQQGGRIKGPES